MSTTPRRRLGCALLVGALIVAACAQPPLARPDPAATEAAIAARIFATLTAAAPPTEAPVTPAVLSRTPVPTTPAATPASTAASASTLPARATLTPTETAKPTREPTATAIATPLAPTVRVTGQSLNVRAGPATTHPVIASAGHGDSLPLLGRTPDGAWLQVQLPDGRAGWVSAALVEPNVPAGAVPVAETVPTAPARPTAQPQPTAAPKASAPRDLEVTFVNLHYECEMKVVEDEHVRVWAYRSFQVDMFVRNNSQTPVTPPWEPSRWILTDGAHTRTSAGAWQWVKGRGQFYPQPVIQPGQVAGWTFLTMPVERNEWVSAVEFEWHGQVYRQALTLGPLGNADNYRDCGEYPAGAGPRTPVWLPTPSAQGRQPQPGVTPLR